MTAARCDPPTWAGAQQLTDDLYWLRTADGAILLWHWCSHLDRWEATGTAFHQQITLDPLHLEPSIWFRDCCGMHGWIRSGAWVPA